jgi:glycosyltransferase 2 family protein
VTDVDGVPGESDSSVALDASASARDTARDTESAGVAAVPAGFGRRRAVIGVAFIALIVAAAGFAIYRQRHSFVDALDKIGAGAMIGSFAAATVGVGLVFFMWREVLTGLNVDMPWRIGARAFFTSQLGKYLPGSVWPVLVQMEAGKARGASRRTMLAANLIMIVISCAVGLIIAAALLPISDTHALSHYWWLLLALPFLIALLHPRALPMVLDRVFALLHRPPLDERLPVRNTVRAAGWSAGSFILQGLHIAIMALTLGGGGFSTVLLCIGGMSLAVCAGVLFVPAPAGAGVRDVILTLVLRSTLSGGQALAVVVASRALLIIVDLVLAAVAATTLKRRA